MPFFKKPTLSLIDSVFDNEIITNLSNHNIDIKDNYNKYKLFLQLSLNELNLCLLDSKKKTFVAFESYTFDTNTKIPTESEKIELLSGTVNDIIATHRWLKKPFKSVHIIFFNNKSTLVPASFFSVNYIEDYLKFNNFVDDYEVITFDKLKQTDAYNVYALPENIKKVFFKHFPHCRIFHFSSTLIEGLLIRHKDQSVKNKVFLNVHLSNFVIIVLEKKQLRYYNSFNYSSTDDFIYYLLFVLEQLNLLSTVIELTVSGKIDKKSALYLLLNQYISKVKFSERSTNYMYSDVFNQVPSHDYYNLLNMDSCV